VGTDVSKMAEMAKNGSLVKSTAELFSQGGEPEKQPAAPQIQSPALEAKQPMAPQPMGR